MKRVNWHLPRLTVGNETFQPVNFGMNHDETDGPHVVFKPLWMIQRYEALITSLAPAHIVELGIYKGGSTIFFHELAEPEKLTAFEIEKTSLPTLERYIEGLANNSLQTYFGMDQADKARLVAAVNKEHDGHLLDLVIDDASHYLEETSESFNALFPLLREGGVYVIEDWPASYEVANDPRFLNKEPLINLINHLVQKCASNPNIITKIEIHRSICLIWRGDRNIDSGKFDIWAL
jgi:predicted O-methyltransferase YrrM